MERNHKLLLAFCALVFIPVGIIWFVTWPLLHAWHFPEVTTGRVVAPVSAEITSDEARNINLWLQSHETAWGPSGERPPAPGNIILDMAGPQNQHVIISIWKHKHENSIVGIQTQQNGPYRMNSFTDAETQALQLSVIQAPHG
ncbi:hypothetical protein [Gluconobacter morbifer]|uniref:Uncharacterized protein n=1 Tax=Gluconobacter morbifer G707 TaxID=1088869 RepID=G6XGL6_9PROT|nr:hypothetical protein [Gluconobacter morbifer]EHH69324.1 hypothetical protein GMO_06310 [Gluconobacter morbifer G707]